MRDVLVILAVFVGSSGLVLTLVLALMLYEGKVALPGTASARALDAQADARVAMAHAEKMRAELVTHKLVDEATQVAMLPSGREE